MNFLEIFKDDDECRAAIELIAPMSFGKVAGRFYTTSGELARWCVDPKAKSIGARIFLLDRPDLKDLLLPIETVEEAEYLALQMGKAKGAFSSAIAMAGHMSGIAPPAALLAILSQSCQRGDELRALFELPNLSGIKMLNGLLNAVHAQVMPREWEGRKKVKSMAPALVPQSGFSKPEPIGILSGLIQQCLDRERVAQADWDKANDRLSEASGVLAKAQADTIAVARAAEIAEHINK